MSNGEYNVKRLRLAEIPTEYKDARIVYKLVKDGVLLGLIPYLGDAPKVHIIVSFQEIVDCVAGLYVSKCEHMYTKWISSR